MTTLAQTRWLAARADIAGELYDLDAISGLEYGRARDDAENGTYSGPLKFLDGHLSSDDRAWQRVSRRHHTTRIAPQLKPRTAKAPA